DPTGRGKFIEAVAPLRKLEPQFDPVIDQWLTLLGGRRADVLKDWIAVVTRLDRGCAALYPTGEKRTGETMPATGLAHLWTTDGPCELGDALSRFNSQLTRCPLIFGDEHVPAGIPTTHIRKLIASFVHRVERKNLPVFNVKGAIRLILAANNRSL